jgi:deazaflavin-dependent oxidoreductase (nitroreductase family)
MYKKPDFFTRHVMNPLINLLMKLGLSAFGSRILSVRGRKSGKVYSTPVNPLEFEGERYLVAPRGETGWVKNIRALGEAELKLGRRREAIAAQEIVGDAKIAVLRAYLKKWKWEVGQFFGGVSADSTDDELRAILPNHPVFRITAAGVGAS